jgi:2-polyprenyl-3-methyl-5-hydroxy-6-metoxy-1,4-benzoquinol methylase
MAARSAEPELMDSPDTSRQMLRNTLNHFRLINKWLTVHRRLFERFIINDMLKMRTPSATLLDLGAGACDMDLWLLRACKTRGLHLNILAIDHDPRVIEYAKETVEPNTEIVVARTNALEIDRLGRKFDYCLATHLLHHLPADDIPILLNKAASVCNRLLLVTDLARSRCAYLAFSALAPLLFHNSFAYTDGRISIKKGFTLAEFQRLAEAVKPAFRTHVGHVFPAHLCIAAFRRR